jgi:hypothetical protein
MAMQYTTIDPQKVRDASCKQRPPYLKKIVEIDRDIFKIGKNL